MTTENPSAPTLVPVLRGHVRRAPDAWLVTLDPAPVGPWVQAFVVPEALLGAAQNPTAADFLRDVRRRVLDSAGPVTEREYHLVDAALDRLGLDALMAAIREELLYRARPTQHAGRTTRAVW